MFVDRVTELESLEKRFRGKKPEFIIVYGRRRVGKTALLQKFLKGKNSIYFLADFNPENFQTVRLTEVLYNYSKDPLLRTQALTSWDAIFSYFSKLAKKERIVVILDEFPFLISVNPSIPSILQRYWDEHFSSTKIFLILCGSYISVMEQKVLGYKSPLYGRRTGQIMLQPFAFFEFMKFFRGANIKELIEYYSICGGIPAYINQFKGVNIWGEIRHTILQPDAYLYNEIPFLLNEELREPRNYFAILQAIAFGKTKLNDISQIARLESSKVIRYLDILRDLRIVKRIVPSTEKLPHKSRKGLYKISDNFTKFWFRFVYPNRTYIESGNVDFVIKKKIKPVFDIYVSEVFEDVCIDFLRREKMYAKIGKWWTKNVEMDIVGVTPEGEFTFGECKWSKRPVGIDILKETLNKIEFFKSNNKVEKYDIVLFSKSGYTNACISRAKKENIRLLDLDEIRCVGQ